MDSQLGFLNSYWAYTYLYWAPYDLLRASPKTIFPIIHSTTMCWIVVQQNSVSEYVLWPGPIRHFKRITVEREEKSSTLLLLLVRHFEITLSNRVARLLTIVLTNFMQSRHSALTIYVDWPPLVSLLNSQQSRCLDLNGRVVLPSAATKPNHQ